MGDDKLTICRHCGATIAKNAKVCPHCGGKNKRSKGCLIALLILIAVLAVLVVLVVLGSMNPYTMSDDAQNMTEDEYKSACSEMTYEELARNADKLVGEKVRFTGEVCQVVFEGESFDSEYRVAVNKTEYDWYDPDSCIYLYYVLGDNPRIIEDDIITFYGEVSGYEEYTSTAGLQIKIPSVTALYVTIAN